MILVGSRQFFDLVDETFSRVFTASFNLLPPGIFRQNIFGAVNEGLFKYRLVARMKDE